MIGLFREQHTSNQYERELKAFFDRLLKMGFLTEEIVHTVLDFFSGSPAGMGDLAEFSRESEARVNRMEMEIDQMSRDIYARRAPVASDFRLMTASSRIVVDLERIGDESKRIAKAVRRILASEQGAKLKGVLRRLIDEIKSMTHEMTTCLSRLDHISASEIIAHDRVINRGYDEVYKEMVALMKTGPDQIDNALDIIWVARSIERIGDHCRNVAELVIFAVEGRDVRHPGGSGESALAASAQAPDAPAPEEQGD